MSFGSFLYLFKEGFKNVWVNRLMSFASIGTLMACMVLIGSSLVLSLNVGSIIGYVEKQNEVMVILDTGLSEEQLAELDTKISMIDNVYDQMFISKTELMKETQAASPDMKDLLEGFEGQEDSPLYPFFDSYRLYFKDISRTQETVEQLQTLDGVQSVSAPSDVAEIVTGIKKAVSVGGVFIVGILIIVSLVIIANTIKVTVFNRRKEISIMKCVGATDSFIRMPFFIEGFLIGLMSALVAFGILWVGYDYIMNLMSLYQSNWIKSAYENMIPFETIAPQMLLYFGCGGIGIGVFGSMFFVNRYLKV